MNKKGCTILAFKYYFKSALSSFVKNGIMTVASFITVSCCLFLFGVFFLFTLNINSISAQIESQCELIVRVDLGASSEKQQDIYNTILEIDNVATAELETPEQALSNFKRNFGENASVLEGLEGKDFLRSSIKISLEDIRDSQKTVAAIKVIDGVATVENRQDIISKVVKFTAAVKSGSMIAMIVLLLIAIFIIQNTIKLSVHARSKEIKIMKFVGATDHFIRMPFIIEGVLIGLLGFLVSFTIIAFGYNAVISTIASVITLFTFVPLQQCIMPLGIGMALFGILMGALGSGLSIKRHLKV